jgi:hypothetical protein
LPDYLYAAEISEHRPLRPKPGSGAIIAWRGGPFKHEPDTM